MKRIGGFPKGNIPHNKGQFALHDLTGRQFGRWTVLSLARRVSYVRHKSGKTDQHRIWLCRCACGTQRQVHEPSLRTGKSRSCGCLAQEVRCSSTIPNDGAFKNKLFGGYERQAQKRGYEFSLSFEQFLVLIKSECFYCGTPPSQVNKADYSSPDFTYNGIDRVINAEGYKPENVVACCGRCNRAKDTMSVEDFLGLVGRIYERHFWRGRNQNVA